MTAKKNNKIFFNKLISFIMVVCMISGLLLPLTSITASAAAPASYSTITAGSTASVSITSSGGAKYFKFVPTQSGTYKFYSTNYTGDPYGALLDASGSTLTSDDDDENSWNFSFTYECTANTTYYVKAYMHGSKTGTYTLNVQTVSVVTPTPTPGGSVVDINAAGGTNYPLFNSGRTGSGYSYSSTSNPDDTSYTNNGYDLYANMGAPNEIVQLGLPFVIGVSINEQATVNIYAYDVDEYDTYHGHSGDERDYIYLVNETTGARTKLGGYLSGQNETWNNTSLTISSGLLEVGNRYHFELDVDCTCGCGTYWVVYVRTVNLIINGSTEPPVVPTTGIENADLSASISSSGLVSVDLTANAYAADTYTLEYKAVCAADNAQYGGKEYSVTIPTTSTEFDTTFQLESGAPRGTYEITVFIKDAQGTVVATRTATASYGYSAVSYNSNGGSQNLPTDGTTYASGDTVTVKFNYVPSRYGYTFLGWSTDRNATEPMYTENGTNTFTIGASDVTLYAVWGLDVCSHEWTETSRTDATCTTDGLVVSTCSVCGDTDETVIPALGHDYVSGICSRCGAEEPEADVWDGSVDISWYNSTDTEFTIYTAEQLAGLAQLVNNGNTFGGKTIYLGNNIDLDNREWTPIGVSETNCFSGTFDGCKHTISNLLIETNREFAGLFGCVKSAVFTLIGVIDANIDTAYSSDTIHAGILCAGYYGTESVTINNCFVSGNVSAENTGTAVTFCGGIIGVGNVTITDSYSTATVYAKSQGERAYAGGILGAIHSSATVSNSYFDGCATAYAPSNSSAYAAGIIGVTNGTRLTSATISNCFVSGTIKVENASTKYVDAIYCPFVGTYTITTNNNYYCDVSLYQGTTSVITTYGILTAEINLHSESWIETNLGWDFDTVWEFRVGSDYPVLQGFGEGGGNTPHTHTFEETSRTEPTCTVDGRINYSCSCGETKVEIILAPGHSIETVVETQATCTSDGLIIDRCTNGGCDYERRTVIHGSHNYSVTDRKDATCEVAGYIEYTCSNCGDKNYEYFNGMHNYVETSRIEAQVGVEGSITYTCTYCSDSYEVIVPALTPVLKNSSVLLIQDSRPWAEDVNTSLLETLKDRGVVSSYNIISTSALATFDLSQYGVVFIANDQSTATYQRLAANAEKLENYVRAGGNLIYGACDEGWGGCGSLTHALPGGVTTSNYYSVHNYIVNDLHPIVTGVYTDNRSLRDELLKGNYCSHTYFNSATLPEGADVILRDANGNPTLVEYNLGDGTVIASGLTWEYFYVRNHYNMSTNYSKYVYDDLVTYMVYTSNTCEHNYEVVETVVATCEENGYTKYVCSLCSHEYMGDIVVASGHTYTETSRTEPTCTHNGEIVYTCNCGDVKVEVIAAVQHSWQIVSNTDATCISHGIVVYACNCGETKSELVEPTQHNYQITAVVDPTCTTDGYIDFACQNPGCEATKRQILEKLGHYYGNDNICDICGHEIEIHTHEFVTVTVAPTCSTMGYTEYTCSCGYSYRDSYVEPANHSWDGGVVTLAATCTSDGLMTYTCQNCSATKTNVIPAGHQWNEVVTVEKTCTTDGSKTKTCTVCGTVETEIIPAGHNWNAGVEVIAPTCTTEGLKLCECSDCGQTQEFVIAALGHKYVNGVCERCGEKFIDNITPSTHPIYGMYFEIDDILSDYGPSLIDEYGLLLDYNSDANLEKVAVYLTQDGTMWRRCIAVKGTNIEYATYVPYLSYQSDIKYTGLNHDWINIFRLSENADGIWCYSNYATIGVNLQDAYGNLLLSLYDIGQAGAETRIFDDLGEMIAWLTGKCVEHTPSDWIVDISAPCLPGLKYKECTVCHEIVESEVIAPTDEHIPSAWIVDIAPTATNTGLRHKECTVCHTTIATETMPILAKLVIANVEAKAGSTVRVTIDIQNNPGIIGAVLTLNYDSALKLISAEAGSAWNTLNFTIPQAFSNPCNFVWDGVSGADYGNGTIIVLTFEVPENADVDTVYNISASYTYGNMINAELETVDVAIENGTITIVNSVGDVNNDGVIDVVDIITLRRYLAGGYGVAIDELASDMNADGFITVADVVLLRRALVG